MVQFSTLFFLLSFAYASSLSSNCLLSKFGNKELELLTKGSYKSYPGIREEFDTLVSASTTKNLFDTNTQKENRLTTAISKAIEEDETRRENIATAAQILVSTFASAGLIPKSAGNSVAFDVHNAEPKVIAHTLTHFVAPALSVRLVKIYKELFTSYTNNSIAVMNEALDVATKEFYKKARFYIQNVVLLGCKFEDNWFTFNEKKKGGKWAQKNENVNFYNPICETPIRPYIQFIYDACSTVMRNTVYNDVRQLIRFYGEFKSQTKTLEEFYQSYKYRFRPNEDTAVYELRFIQELENNYNYKKGAAYLVPVNEYVQEKRSVEDYERMIYHLPADSFIYNHLAVVIRIRHHNIGYMILDLNIGMEEPIFLMENMTSPHKSYARVGQNVIHFELLPNNMVEARLYKGSFDGVVLAKYKYYVEKPFCAFMEDTFKPNLLSPFHGMRVFRPRFAQVNFKILPKSLMRGDYYFTLLASNKTFVDNTVSTTNVLFKDLFNMTEEQTSLMTRVANELSMSVDKLWGNLVAVKTLILDNQDLVKEMYELHKKLTIGDIIIC